MRMQVLLIYAGVRGVGWSTMKPEQLSVEDRRSALKEAGGQFFVWAGVAGTVLMIVSHWSSFVALAGWIASIVDYFSALLNRFWNFLGSIIDVQISSETATLLSFLLFYSSLIFGIILLAGRRKTRKSRSIFNAFCYGIRMFIFAAAMILIINTFVDRTAWLSSVIQYPYPILLFVMPFIVLDLFPMEDRDILSYVMTIFIIINYDIFDNAIKQIFGFRSQYFMDSIISLSLAIVLASVVLLISSLLVPTRPLIKSVGVLLAGVVSIFGLSEISKMVGDLC